MIDSIRQHRVATSFDSHDSEPSSSASGGHHDAEVEASPPTPATSINVIHPREGYFQHHALVLSELSSATPGHSPAAGRNAADLELTKRTLEALQETVKTVVKNMGDGGAAGTSTPSGGGTAGTSTPSGGAGGSNEDSDPK